jgi:hypothetical protein
MTMGFFKKLFGQKEEPKKVPVTKTFTEKDNMGTRQDTLELASTYWIARISSTKKDPFILYMFDTEAAARSALMELPCIHVAEDSKKLICTEILIFGYYPNEQKKYEAILCGGELTKELWQLAKDSFIKHGGQRKNDAEPEKHASVTTAPAPKPGKVTFVREDRTQKMGHTMIYRIHKAPDAASAKAFLQEHPVTQQLLYIIVETPEGNICRDIEGIYTE